MSGLAAKLQRLKAPPLALSGGAAGDGVEAVIAPASGSSGQGERVLLQDRTHGPGYRHGRVLIGDARTANAATVASLALDEGLAGIDASRMLLVDTETTGLQSGSGTLPFVIGLAWFEAGALVVRQLFVPRPGQERPLLQRLAERLHGTSVLVTFNGKCFDWPLLRTRFVMNRLEAPPQLPHLDLLHVARRVFKRRLGATRLTDLEQQVLDFHREGDIAGADIPAVYFDWLRHGRPADIERVLEHNAQDLISMAAVLAELCRRFEAPADDDAAEDCLGLARVAERAGDEQRAWRFAAQAARRSTSPEVAFDACAFLAKLCVRHRAWADAARWLERATRVRSERAAVAHLAYARVCEHGLRDFARALLHARLGSAAESAEASSRRVARISRRLVGQ
ncbi:MAG: ribonuclease H-like domain-containing protein [Myxococcaceae bacterium]|nr:ribonuclease H-like domain-containing protein [Myxococcaceae bacterium]